MAHGIVSHFSSHSHAPPLALTDADYCDDTALPMLSSARDLVSKTGDVIYIAHTAFSSYGLMLNYESNETNVVPFFAGRGAAKARQELYLKENRHGIKCFGAEICLILLIVISIWALSSRLLTTLSRSL